MHAPSSVSLHHGYRIMQFILTCTYVTNNYNVFYLDKCDKRILYNVGSNSVPPHHAYVIAHSILLLQLYIYLQNYSTFYLDS
jgi:hypothetical protein